MGRRLPLVLISATIAAVTAEVARCGGTGRFCGLRGPDAGLSLVQSLASRRNGINASVVRNIQAAQAALGADGVPHILLQEQAEHRLWRPGGGHLGAGRPDALQRLRAERTAVAARVSLRAENTRLREETASLQSLTAALRSGNAALREEDVALRKQDTELQLQDAQLRRAVPDPVKRSPTLRWWEATGSRSELQQKSFRKSTVLWGGLIAFSVLLVCCFFRQCFLDTDDADSDDEDLLLGLDGHQTNSFCKCCWCCCTPGVLHFLLVTLVITVIAGCVLWEVGILQPVLAQFATYVYVIGLFAAFIAILVYEFWKMLQAVAQYVVTQMEILTRFAHPFSRTAAKKSDIFAS